MSTKQVIFMGLLFATGTLISLTFGGLWLGGGEVDAANAVAVFKQANILGTWSVSVPNVSFFLVGMKSLMNMDFAFFTGEMAVVQWFLYMTLGLGMMWGFFIVMIGVIRGLFSPR